MSQQDGTKFLHFRKRGANGVIESRGGLTVAYRPHGANVRYGLAQCSKEDNFCKDRGRKLAEGRMGNRIFGKIIHEASEAAFVKAISETAQNLGYERSFSSKRISNKTSKVAKKATKKVTKAAVKAKQ